MAHCPAPGPACPEEVGVAPVQTAASVIPW